MRVAIGAACIRDGLILLVRKRESWILPGGKPEPGETDIDCLIRELHEELLGLYYAYIDSCGFFGTFEGTTPHRGDVLQCKVYFAELEGTIAPAREISEVIWTANPLQLNLSDITRKIILKLKSDGYL